MFIANEDCPIFGKEYMTRIIHVGQAEIQSVENLDIEANSVPGIFRVSSRGTYITFHTLEAMVVLCNRHPDGLAISYPGYSKRSR